MLTMEGLLHRLSALQWQATAQRLPPWVNSLLVVLLAYSLAGISWQLWPQQIGERASTLAAALPVSTVKGQNLDAVAALQLLGVAELEAKKVVPQSVVDAPETRLSLTLRGIIALSSGGIGRALIAEGSADERLYKVGDTLSGSAVLHEVRADKVILKRGGRFETLTLPRERLEAEPVSAQRGERTGSRGAAIGSGTTTQLRSLRDEIAGNPQLAFSLVQAQPVLEQGKIKGYRVNPGRQRKLFQGTGLRPGDVVTHVNGVALSDPAQMAALFAQFKTADRFDLQLERGGQATSLSIDLGQ